jgi:signal recognition particle receptor subunit beta
MALRGSASTLGTVTSMDVNDASVTVEDARGKKTKSGSAATTTKRARVVDLPGHPRLRAKIDAHASRARGVVFVLDAVDFAANRGEVAERLHALLADPAIRKRRVPFLVACNKSEKIAAHPVDFVRKRLEKEIETLVRSILHWFPYDRVGVVNAVS